MRRMSTAIAVLSAFRWRRRPELSAVATCLWLTVLLSMAAQPAAARERARVIGGSHQVSRGSQAFIDVSVPRGARCRLTVRENGKTRRTRAVRARTGRLRFMWQVPADAAPGAVPTTIRCAARPGRSRRAVATLTITVVADTPGAGSLLQPRGVRIRNLKRKHRPRGGGLPVLGAPPAAPSGFTTFWPLATRLQTRITQSPGGAVSHHNAATRYAVDLDLPGGTEIRAGFSGTVERIVNSCRPGAGGCGDTFGNYVLLRASDGTCALHGHLSRVDVTPGAAVARYTLLGLSGYTGKIIPATPDGAHLHYDRVECGAWRSLPWAPIEGGSLAEGASITSQNTPECTALQGGCGSPQGPTVDPQGPTQNPQTPPGDGGSGGGGTPTPVNAFDNYGPAVAGHAMCRGNPSRPESMPGGTATQTFTVPANVRTLESALVQIDPDPSVTAHAALVVNGTAKASADAAANGDTRFRFGSVPVAAGDQISLSISFTATYGKIITVYGAGNPGGTFNASNSCPDGAQSFSTSAHGLRAVISGTT